MIARLPRPRLALAAVVAAACLVATAWRPEPAAAFPGQNGKIAFESSRDGGLPEIYVVNPDGSGQTRLTNSPDVDSEPAFSPDGRQIAFISRRDGNPEVYVMDASGSGQTRLTNTPGAFSEGRPAWSPDGGKIVFTSRRDGNDELYVMDANGQHQTRLTFTDEQELTPAWSPDGSKIAFYSNPSDDLTGLYTMNPTGAGRKQITSGELDLDPSWSLDSSKIAFSRRVPSKGDHISVVAATGGTVTNLTGDILTTGEVNPSWSPDGQKILFSHLGGGGLVTINPNGTGRTPFPSGDSSDLHGDWGTATSCPDVKVGFATAQGCFTETAPGSGFFETEQKAWVGGFEIKPRPGGALRLDTNGPSVSAAGAGADVIFAGFRVPIPVGVIPVGVQNATFDIGTPGTLTGSLIGLPVKSKIKVAWAANGKSASYEQEVSLEELTKGIGQFVTLSPGTSVGQGTGKVKASLKNGTGFVLNSAELKIDEVSVIPRRLRLPRTLKLKNLLLSFKLSAGKPLWTGQAGISLPLTRGDLDLTGKVFVFDDSLAGFGFEVNGINKRALGPLFLQKVGGAGAFLPTPTPPPEVIAATEFGYDLKIGATLGPRVRGVKLATIDGQIQGGSLVSGCADTAARPDPTKLEAVAKLAPLEQFVRAGLAEVNITQRACIYPGTGAAAVAIEGVLDGSISFVNNALAYRGITTGFISSAGASYEGDVSINLPALPDLDGKAIVSSIGVAACTDLFFFEGGFAHLWGGSSVPQTFSGCDLGPYRVLQRSPAPRPQARAGGPRAAAADTVNLPAGLPHAAFSAAGAAGPPLVRLSGPGGVELDSPADGSPLLNDSVVILPVAHEKTTYVVVNDPKAGNWEITGAEAANPISELRLAEGLPEPRVKGKVRASRGGGRRKGKGSSSRSKPKSKPGKLRFSYRLRPIPGQKVIFTERGEGIASELGKARGRRGTISFKPTTALDRKRTIEAEVIQDGFPRALITVAKFKAPKPPKLRKPKLRAKRTKNAVKASWRSVPGASRYLAALSAGRETLYRVLTKKSKLRFKRTPKKGKLKLTVQALSEVQAPGPTAKLKLRPAKRSAHKHSH